MNKVLIIGSGISGLSCGIKCAENGIAALLVSPFSSERSQSVMAAGGINAVLTDCDSGDSVESHIEDTLKGGCGLGGTKAVTGLCSRGAEIINYLERIGTVFSVDNSGRPARRAFGGQSHKRTCFCGASTGKQIVSALVMEARRYEAAGLIKRRLWSCFHSALIRNGKCCGALLYDESTGKLEAVYADAVVIATGGQNSVFGKTTGSTQCDGYAAGKLFMQGVELKNLEFIQYHPTTIETPQKRMLISEAVRGEGGRLFYHENGRRIYFMEDKYGSRGNLMTRDVISREIYSAKRDVFLDISFLNKKDIDRKLPEVRDICRKYRGIDISKEAIPVAPSVHFFMGGIAVHNNHETNIRDLYAVGECASMYHGANRLGGNSLLAAIYSGWVAAETIYGRESSDKSENFSEMAEKENAALKNRMNTKSYFPVMYIRDMLADTMCEKLGIVRSKKTLDDAMNDINFYLSVEEKISFDPSVTAYFNYSLKEILVLSKAIITCAGSRKESRGAHYRSDYPEINDELGYSTIISYDNGSFNVRPDKEHEYEG